MEIWRKIDGEVWLKAAGRLFDRESVNGELEKN
jgi:hypothetical protein